MRIAFIAAGAGGMYCGSCIRDTNLTYALREMGHDVLLLPVYTPLRTDARPIETDQVFFGAVNIFLQQHNRWWGRVPRFLRGWLDNPWLLRHIPTSQKRVDASQLGDLALSMLRGELGRQSGELEHLVRFLTDHFQPDVVQLANSMLLGMTRSLRTALPDAKFVCTVQGEDLFLEDLEQPYRQRVIETMRERAGDIDRFLSISHYYVQPMCELLDVEPERMRVTRVGVSLDGYADQVAEGCDRSATSLPTRPFRVGYLARQCPEKGLGVAVEAFRQLAERVGKENVQLVVAGYLGARDKDFVAGLRRQVRDWGLARSVEWHGEVDRLHKVEMLQSLHVFTVPAVYREPKGLPVLEAMAAGVPVVQPAHGAYPEILEATGGGRLVPPEDPAALAAVLEELYRDPALRLELAARAWQGVRRAYTVEAMAAETSSALEELFLAAEPGLGPGAEGEDRQPQPGSLRNDKEAGHGRGLAG